MTEAEWFAIARPLYLFDSCPRPLTARQERLIALGACRLIPVDMLGVRAEGWLSAAEGLAERPEIKVSSTTMRGRLESAWRSQLQGRPPGLHARAALYQLLRGAVRPTLVNVGLARGTFDERTYDGIDRQFAEVVRDVVGNPFRPVAFVPEWRTTTALQITHGMYDSREFSAMPILADALQDADCDSNDILNHCRDTNAVHVRGCWVVDLVLGKC